MSVACTLTFLIFIHFSTAMLLSQSEPLYLYVMVKVIINLRSAVFTCISSGYKVIQSLNHSLSQGWFFLPSNHRLYVNCDWKHFPLLLAHWTPQLHSGFSEKHIFFLKKAYSKLYDGLLCDSLCLVRLWNFYTESNYFCVLNSSDTRWSTAELWGYEQVAWLVEVSRMRSTE